MVLFPLPSSCGVRKTDAQAGRSSLQIEGETIALAFLCAIVSSIGEHADFEQRNGLHLLVAFGEGAMDEEVVAGLLDHVLHADEGRLVILKRLLQSFDGLFDRLPVLARRSLAFGGTNKAFGEDGLDQRKHLLAARLCPHDSADRFTFTAPLSIPVKSGEPMSSPTCFQAGLGVLP